MPARKQWRRLGELMGADPKQVMEALLAMGKIDIDGVLKAGAGS